MTELFFARYDGTKFGPEIALTDVSLGARIGRQADSRGREYFDRIQLRFDFDALRQRDNSKATAIRKFLAGTFKDEHDSQLIIRIGTEESRLRVRMMTPAVQNGYSMFNCNGFDNRRNEQ